MLKVHYNLVVHFRKSITERFAKEGRKSLEKYQEEILLLIKPLRESINPFVPNAPILYTLKTLKNLTVF